MKSPIAVVVLAAGAGTRMKSALPKVRSHYDARLSTWDAWAPVSERAHGHP